MTGRSAVPVPTSGTGGRRFAVLGSPIDHSLSPTLHRAAYRALGLEGITYERFEVRSGELAAFWQDGPGAELDGASVTMPGKPEAFALADEADAGSRRLRIANTLLRLLDGTVRAENHDVHGIAEALRRAKSGAASPDDGSVGGVLGSGATALSAVVALLELGATDLMLSARSPEKLEALRALGESAGAAVRIIPWDRAHEVLTAGTVVSALAAEGAAQVAGTWSQLPDVPVPGTVLDVLYHPWPAPVAALLEERGSRVVSGLEMLLHQADQQIRSMLGVAAAPLDPMREAALAELASR